MDKKKMRKRKIINLVYGSEESHEWRLQLIFSGKQHICGFFIADETSNYRNRVRSNDRKWASWVFPQRWKQQFVIHHSWLEGEYCYFLTPEQHHNLHYGTS